MASGCVTLAPQGSPISVSIPCQLTDTYHEQCSMNKEWRKDCSNPPSSRKRVWPVWDGVSDVSLFCVHVEAATNDTCSVGQVAAGNIDCDIAV